MCCIPRMFQGDQCYILFTIYNDDGNINIDDVEKIEFTVGTITKLYPGDVKYDKDKAMFLFPVTQADTFALAGYENCQARIKFFNSEVYGTYKAKLNVMDANSKNVI